MCEQILDNTSPLASNIVFCCFFQHYKVMMMMIMVMPIIFMFSNSTIIIVNHIIHSQFIQLKKNWFKSNPFNIIIYPCFDNDFFPTDSSCTDETKLKNQVNEPVTWINQNLVVVLIIRKWIFFSENHQFFFVNDYDDSNDDNNNNISSLTTTTKIIIIIHPNLLTFVVFKKWMNWIEINSFVFFSLVVKEKKEISSPNDDDDDYNYDGGM